jgi:thiol-disulfide isomerase/thioredoxin
MRIALATILLAITACTQLSKKDNGETTALEKKEGLPAIDIVTTSGDSVKVNALEGRVILILFTPDCDHCQREAADISNHLDLFDGYKLYFVAAHTNDVLNDFAVKYNLSNKPNVVFSQGPIVPVVTLIKPTSMPTILIYGDDGSLVKRFDGETNVERIAEFL